MKFTRETFKRMLRTFLQAAIACIVAGFATIDFSSGKDVVRSALIGLVISSIAAGLSAVMNLQTPAETELGAGGNLTFDNFVKNYINKGTDYDKVCGVQCVDLIKVYLDKCFGIKAGAWGNAKDYYEIYNNITALKTNFTRIKNTPLFVPKKGDICIWGANISDEHNFGHIAIATGEGNIKEFYTYDQNWGGKPMRKVKHSYKAFLGVLRPKDQTPFKATATTKPASTSKTTPTIPYKKGDVVTLTANVNVRTGASINCKQKTVSQLTADGKKHATSTKGSDKAVLKSGTKVTLQTVTLDGSDIWAQIPSGWICLCYNGKNYAK